MNAEDVSKPDRAATFITLSYGSILAEAIVIALLIFGFLFIPNESFAVGGILFILVFILPWVGVLFGLLGMRFSSTESLSKKARRGIRLNEGMFVLILVLVVIIALATISGCACGDTTTFHTISNSLPS